MLLTATGAQLKAAAQEFQPKQQANAQPDLPAPSQSKDQAARQQNGKAPSPSKDATQHPTPDKQKGQPSPAKSAAKSSSRSPAKSPAQSPARSSSQSPVKSPAQQAAKQGSAPVQDLDALHTEQVRPKSRTCIYSCLPCLAAIVLEGLCLGWCATF